jgi:hypothetical protein
LYAAVLNVVWCRRLWPRSILQPPLTDAHQRVLKNIARQEERRPERRVGVGVEQDPPKAARADADYRMGDTVACTEAPKNERSDRTGQGSASSDV